MSTTTETRRRSVDVGGLRLATENQGQGNGWLGNQDELQTKFAELLGQLYRETQQAVSQHVNPLITSSPSQENRVRLIHALDTWEFQPYNLSRDDVMTCTILLFEALLRTEGLLATLGITLDQITKTVHHLREIYRAQNAYHNYEHALDVLQASQAYLRAAGMVPPVTILLESPETKWKPERQPHQRGDMMSVLDPVEIFALYLAAIGHDVGHPGFTNAFMKNAQAPLSVMFDDKSALENMHFQLLMQIMRHNGLAVVFDSRPSLRKLLHETVLATDMRVHFDFMTHFQEALRHKPSVNYQKLLLSQAIIKCADISNPSRPHCVSTYWASALVKEWTNQRHFEAKLDLPYSMSPSDTPLAEAQSQVFFMRNFATPLLELMVRAVPECQVFLDECLNNFGLWEQRAQELQSMKGSQRPSLERENIDEPLSSALSDDYMSAFPLALPRIPSPHPPSRAWSSDSSSVSEASLPSSPTESISSQFSPPSDMIYMRHRRPSSNGSSTSSDPPSLTPASPSLPPPPATTGHSIPDVECSLPSSISRCSHRAAAVPSTGLENTLSSIRAAGQAASHAGLGIRKQKSMSRNLNRSSWSSPLPPSKNPFHHLESSPTKLWSGGNARLPTSHYNQPLSTIKFMMSTSDIPAHQRTDSDASSTLGDVEDVKRVLATGTHSPIVVHLRGDPLGAEDV